MSWGTDFLAKVSFKAGRRVVDFVADLFLNRISKDQIEFGIEQNEKEIRRYEDEILLMVSSNPSMFGRDAENRMFEIRVRVSETLKELRQCYVDDYKFFLYNHCQHLNDIDHEIGDGC